MGNAPVAHITRRQPFVPKLPRPRTLGSTSDQTTTRKPRAVSCLEAHAVLW